MNEPVSLQLKHSTFTSSSKKLFFKFVTVANSERHVHFTAAVFLYRTYIETFRLVYDVVDFFAFFKGKFFHSFDATILFNPFKNLAHKVNSETDYLYVRGRSHNTSRDF